MEQYESGWKIKGITSSLVGGVSCLGGKRFLMRLWLVWILWSAGEVWGQVPPANDVFRKPDLLVGVSGAVTGVNSNATFQAGEPQHAGVPGGKSVWYRWVAPSTSHATFATTNVTFDTVLAVYTGAAVNSLKEVTSNDDVIGGSGQESRIEMDVKEGVEYRIAVDGHAASSPEGQFALVWETAPLNDLFERAQLLSGFAGVVKNDNHGGTAELDEPAHVGFGANATVWFAWPSVQTSEVTFTTEGSAFDTVLAVYTGDSINDLSLVVENDDIQPDGSSSVTWQAEAGVRYRIVVGGKGGTGRYVLHWRQQLLPPLNDLFSQPQALSGFAGQQTGTSAGATVEEGEPSPHETAGGSSVWFSWTAPRDGEMKFSTADSAFDTQLSVFTGDMVNSLQLVAANDDTPDGLESGLEFNAVANTTYWLRLDGKGGAGDIYWLRWVYEDLVSSNNMFAQATPLKGVAGNILGENASADSEAGEPFHAGDHGGRSIWYRWVAPVSLRMVVNTEGSTFDTLLAVYTGVSPIAGLKEIASNDDADVGNLVSELAFDAVAGVTYWIAVDGSSERDSKPAGMGEVHLRWNPSSATSIFVSPRQGRLGDVIQVYGQGLSEVVSVQFGNVDATFTLNEEGVSVLIPDGAVTAPITVVTGGGDVRATTEDFVVLPSNRPLLSIRWVEGGALRLAWPSLLPGFQVQRRRDAGTAGVWETLPGPVIQIGGEYVLDVQPESSQGFYRLFQP